VLRRLRMTTFQEALALLMKEVAQGHAVDYYLTPTSIIAITDQGEFVFFEDTDPDYKDEPK
jgi:hypothetical protein